VAAVSGGRSGIGLDDPREGMVVSEELYKQIALEDIHGHWELHAGRLVRKPGMTARHANSLERLLRQLVPQLPVAEFAIRPEAGRLRRPEGSYYQADVAVVPREYVRDLIEHHPTELEVYRRPVPFVAEVWSPSTGTYDINTKIPGYKERGDAEVWRLHPLRHEVTIWRRQPDGSYSESVVTSGTVELWALPGVRINIDELFEY
jgi:Uma2 family endonuclease